MDDEIKKEVKKQVKRTKVSLVTKPNEHTALVEYVAGGKPIRGFIPVSSLDAKGTVANDDLQLATPYGLPFGDMLEKVTVTPSEIENALHNAGIWTIEDVQTQPNIVRNALGGLLGLNYGALMQKIKTYSQEVSK